jgi:hypothetical protein
MSGASGLVRRLADVLAPVVAVVEEADGSLTVNQDGTVASIRVVSLAEDLEIVSLTQLLAWDLSVTDRLRRRVAEQAGKTALGTVTLVGKGSARSADVVLRYNFPGAGLSDDALRTLVLLVLAGGADVRSALGG